MEKRVLNLIIFIGFISLIIFIYCIFYVISQGIVGLFIGHFEINFTSPQNITYNFNYSSFYNLTLNVSSNRNVTVWRYSLIWNNITLNDSVLFTNPATFFARKGRNKIIVYAVDNYGNTGNNSIYFYVNATNNAPIIQGLDERIYVCENKQLPEFGVPQPYFNVTDMDIDENVQDLNIVPDETPFSISPYPIIVNSTTKTYNIQTGALTKTDAGGANNGGKNYSQTVNVWDNENSDSKNVNLTVIEVNNAPVIENIGVKTIWTKGDNSSFNYIVHTSDEEDGHESSGKLIFNISFSGDYLFNITNKGVIDFNANESYLGVHNISVCARDLGLLHPHINISLCNQEGGILYSCNNFSLTVTNSNRQPQFINWWPVNLSINAAGTQEIFFNVSVYDADGEIPDVYWYVDDSLKRYDSGIDSGRLIQNFSYTFSCGISGEHSAIAVVTDGELNATLRWNINLIAAACPISVPPGPSPGYSPGLGPIVCLEKWGCKEWSECKNLKQAQSTGDNIFGLASDIFKRCSLFSWKEDVCGFQTRKCNDLNKCGTNLTKPGFVKECYYTINPNCRDRIKNCHNGSCEILTDCGGPCKACPTCSDKIRNLGETGVDCGGPCAPCKEETPKKPFDYMKIALILLFLVLAIFILIVILLVLGYIKKKKHLENIKKPKKE